MFCKYCGKEINDDAKFCVYCGKEVKRGGSGDSGRKAEKSGEPEKPERVESPEEEQERGPKKIVYIVPAVLIIVVLAAIVCFMLFQPKTEDKRQDDEISLDSEREEETEEEAGESTGEDAAEAEAEEASPEVSEQIRAFLESELRDLEAQYGYADMNPQSTSLDFSDYDRREEWKIWTGLSGIAKAEICDLDGDGQEELLVILLEEKNIYLCVYEADVDMPSEAPVKKAEVVIERSGDIHNHEDVCRMVDGNGVKYLLFLQAYWGGSGDGYYAQARLYQYDGSELYTPLTIRQEAEASAEFVYFAREYEADGTMLSEEVIYDDCGQYGTYLDEDYCRGRMKELFGNFGIGIGDRAKIYNYDGNFDDFLATGTDSEELMKLRMQSSYIDGDYCYFSFNSAGEMPEAETAEDGGQYILPGSDVRMLTFSDLEGLTQEECRLARNELYARHGRIFDDAELQDYFNSRDWYTGTVTAEEFTDDVLNDFEMANRDLIVEYEKEMGYR